MSNEVKLNNKSSFHLLPAPQRTQHPMSTPTLFQPTQIGDIQLAHRIVHAPTTRYRVDETHTPVPLVAEYYGQRATTPGSLLITEATLIAQRAGGAKNTPGVWSDAQISSWKAVGALSSNIVSVTDLPPRSQTESTRRDRSSSFSSGRWAAPSRRMS
jgi:hypothetical protein